MKISSCVRLGRRGRGGEGGEEGRRGGGEEGEGRRGGGEEGRRGGGEEGRVHTLTRETLRFKTISRELDRVRKGQLLTKRVTLRELGSMV